MLILLEVEQNRQTGLRGRAAQVHHKHFVIIPLVSARKHRRPLLWSGIDCKVLTMGLTQDRQV